MKKKRITCVICPNGCSMVVLMNGGQVIDVQNNLCSRGIKYALTEATFPKRILTTTVRVRGSGTPLVPVRTAKPIPKEKMVEAMHELNKIKINAPVHVGDVILADLLDTNVAVIATRNIQK